MFKTRFHRCALLAAVVAALLCLHPAPSARADEPQLVTVALLLPAPVGDECLDDPVVIVFDGPTDATDDALFIESTSHFGDFAGADLTPTDAQYIARGGRGGEVRGVDMVLPPHGVMRLGPRSDAVVEFCAFVYTDGSTLRYEPNPENATGFLVIVSGSVR